MVMCVFFHQRWPARPGGQYGNVLEDRRASDTTYLDTLSQCHLIHITLPDAMMRKITRILYFIASHYIPGTIDPTLERMNLSLMKVVYGLLAG